MNNLRPCVFKTENGEEFKGYFHIWTQISIGRTAFSRGIVEKESGEIVQIAPKDITFVDRNYDVDTILETLVQEADKMINEGQELSETAEDIRALDIEKEYISALKESVKREYYGKGIIYTLKILKLL